MSAETRVLLFCDIEGSTRLAAAAGDGYAEVLAVHRALIRAATARHQGVERGTDGDGFFLLFPVPVRQAQCLGPSRSSDRRRWVASRSRSVTGTTD